MKFFASPSSTLYVWVWTENMCGNENHDQETKHIQDSVGDLLHVKIGNLD